MYRSALADYPSTSLPVQPTVSAIVPVFNEISYIQTVVDNVLDQDYSALIEIWFVDGMSNDGTFEELQQLQKKDRRIKVLSNVRRNQAAAINLALEQIQTDIIIRLDAHARYAPSVIRRSVQALLQTGAGGVGAIARPSEADTLIGQSIVAVHKSKLGVGIAKFRQETAEGWADTVWNGCYWKHVVDQVGSLREDLPRSEDNDFHVRVRTLGYGLYLEPTIEAYYYPRQSFAALWRQYLTNGAGVVQTLFENPEAISLRHLIPLTFIVSLVLPLFGAIFWVPAMLVFLLVLSIYIAALMIFSLIAWRQKPGLYVLFMPVTFMLLHISYGLGSLKKLLEIAISATAAGLRFSQPKSGEM
jgi:glycosyltransferase involved in cell wall biosynthesis